MGNDRPPIYKRRSTAGSIGSIGGELNNYQCKTLGNTANGSGYGNKYSGNYGPKARTRSGVSLDRRDRRDFGEPAEGIMSSNAYALARARSQGHISGSSGEDSYGSSRPSSSQQFGMLPSPTR